MTDETEKIYKILQDIMKNVWEQQKYAEVKNGVLLTLNIAILAIITRISKASITINNDIYTQWIFYTLIALLIIHIVCIMQSFFPKDRNKEDIKWTNDDINIFFFGDIQKLNSSRYLKLLLEKIGADKVGISQVALLDLANQIVKLSEIAQSKYTSFKFAIYRMYGLLFMFFIYFTYLYFK
ncbi:MAG: DUF5706 domain-containing protein [Sulfuricurvum sp.]|nr:DUF5706 domain-containing protein [Sulfuricurvum sp.]